jgi:enoyl-CoA hydratase/carnithine racemase
MRDLCLTGRTVGPDEARELRVVDEVLEPRELLDRALERALELAALPAYPQVKAQLRGPLIAELGRIAAGNDPLISGEGQA